MFSFTEAQRAINEFAHSFGTEELELDKALGRVLAQEVYADRDYPPFNRSAMDGFAIRNEDISNGIKDFAIIDTIYAGKTTDKRIAAGQCFKIMTGASVPLSADAVIRVEDSVSNGNEVSFNIKEVRPFQNIARRGEDAKRDVLLAGKSLLISPSLTGLLATLGKQKILVERLPSVAIITTGDEVVTEGSAISNVEIRNSNLPVLKALFRKSKIEATYSTHVPDDKDKLLSAISRALSYDVVVMSGGVSAGDADYVPGVLQQAGVTKLFHKVAIRPGKPFWCGRKNDSRLVFALPGNPFSCLVTFTLFIQPYLQSCFGLSYEQLYMPIRTERKQRVELDEFFPVKPVGNPSGLEQLALNGSGDIRLAYEAQALGLHPSGKKYLQAGEVVQTFPFS
jgi:molybdopterin molybdotransferase